MEKNLVKVENKLCNVEDGKAVLYGGYKVAEIKSNGEKGNKRSGIYQLINPHGDRLVFTVTNGMIVAVNEWNTNPPIEEMS